MMGQNVVLLTREIGFDDDRPQEMVVGVEVDGERFDVPMDSRIAVECEAGASIQTVTLTLFADTVRYAPADALAEAVEDPTPVCAWPLGGGVPSDLHVYSGARCEDTWGGLMAESPEDQTVTYCLPVCEAHEHTARDAGWAIRPPGATAPVEVAS